MINPAKAYTVDEYIEILYRRIWYIIIPFSLIVAGACAFAVFAPRQYKASTLILVSPQRIPEAFVQATVTSKVEERLQSIAQEVLSRTRLEQVINELKLYQQEQKKLSLEETVEVMRKDIKVALPTKSDEKGYFTISYIGHEPNVVTMVANRLGSHFIEENLKIREMQAVGTSEFLANELTSVKEKLDHLEAAVAQYKRRHMGELPEQRESNIKILEQLQNQYQRVGENLRAAQDRKLFLQKQLTDMEMPLVSQGDGPFDKERRQSLGKSSYLQKEMLPLSPYADTTSETVGERKGSYETQRESLIRSLEELQAKYTDNHPDVIAVKKSLADHEAKKDEKGAKDKKGVSDLKRDPRYKELRNQLDYTDHEIARLKESEREAVRLIDKYRTRIEQTPAREQDMASLMREHQSTKENYERLLQKSQSAQQAENLEKRQKGEQFRIIDPARVPEKPFSPDIPKILLIGLFAGIGGGFGLAFLREQMDRSFRESGDVEITLGLKVLATIPHIEEKES